MAAAFVDSFVYSGIFDCDSHERVCHVGAISLAGDAGIRHACSIRHNTSDKAAEKVFPYIFVYEDTPEYEMLMREKDLLKSKIIKL